MNNYKIIMPGAIHSICMVCNKVIWFFEYDGTWLSSQKAASAMCKKEPGPDGITVLYAHKPIHLNEK